MEIKTFKKDKNGMYKITFVDDRDMFIHEDLIIKYNLLVNKEINDAFFEQLIEENKRYEVYNMALKYLKIKLRSIKELRDFLNNKKIEVSLIEEVIKLLIKQNYLNDLIYAKAFLNDQINLTKNGPLKIRKDLSLKGIDKKIIDDVLNSFDITLIIERIEYLITKKIKSNKNKGSYLLKQKILNELINTGYQREDILNILNKTIIQDDQDIVKREYDKLYKKLSKKYSGLDLEYQIKQRLYQKGFVI